jgi:uncharacterized protein (TIGR03437 family)
VWKNKCYDGLNVIDLTSQTILLTIGPVGVENYLPESNRLVFTGYQGMLFADGDSLEMYADFGLETPLGREAPQRVWAPDWMLIRAVAILPDFEEIPGILIGHIPQLARAPAVTAQGVVNAATGLPGPIAPGEIVSIFGQNLGPVVAAGPTIEEGLRFATAVEQTKVLFEGVPGVVLYAGLDQINAVVPETVQQLDSAAVQVVHYDIPSQRIAASVTPYSPGIFSYIAEGKAYAAATNSDGVIEGPTSPFGRGSVATFYATGLGLAQGETTDSIAARPSPLPILPSISIGGHTAKILYAGVSPGLTAALTQINADTSGRADW